jgi:hypothetical protein
MQDLNPSSSFKYGASRVSVSWPAEIDPFVGFDALRAMRPEEISNLLIRDIKFGLSVSAHPGKWN